LQEPAEAATSSAAGVVEETGREAQKVRQVLSRPTNRNRSADSATTSVAAAGPIQTVVGWASVPE
jgi:hypothetical protein